MTTSAALQPEPAMISACTVSREVQNFDLLIEDMEHELGESWGDLPLEDACAFLVRPEAAALEFIALAIDTEDEHRIPLINDIIATAKDQKLKVVIIAEEVSPSVLHQLLRNGADDFVPYPLPEGALHEVIERFREPPAPVPELASEPTPPTAPKSRGDKDAAILPVHGLAGGVGATTFAVNLAWELTQNDVAKSRKKGAEAGPPPRVCLLDLDFQFGSASTYLDLSRRESVYELLTNTESMDSESFMNSLQVYNDSLHVLTAPAEILPLDIITPDDVSKLIEIARVNFDFVVIDMPSTLVAWTETVLSSAHVYFALMELDMRSAQNALRLLRLLKGEDLPVEKLRFALNRAPKFTDLSGKARVKRMAESLDIDIELMLPDGAAQVMQACDHGMPVAQAHAKNPLRKELNKLAVSLKEIARAEHEVGS